MAIAARARVNEMIDRTGALPADGTRAARLAQPLLSSPPCPSPTVTSNMPNHKIFRLPCEQLVPYACCHGRGLSRSEAVSGAVGP
ncbi:hypothetical protein EJB05_18698, partial [Eragrostis curvula]